MLHISEAPFNCKRSFTLNENEREIASKYALRKFIAGSLESPNSSILAGQTFLRFWWGKKSGFYDN